MGLIQPNLESEKVDPKWRWVKLKKNFSRTYFATPDQSQISNSLLQSTWFQSYCNPNQTWPMSNNNLLTFGTVATSWKTERSWSQCTTIS